MSLQLRHERSIILYMRKILHNLTSNDFGVQFTEKIRRGLASKKKGKQVHQSINEHSFGILGPKFWNSIPYTLTTIRELGHFKNELTKFVLSVPDKPPVKGYTTPDSNSLLSD